MTPVPNSRKRDVRWKLGEDQVLDPASPGRPDGSSGHGATQTDTTLSPWLMSSGPGCLWSWQGRWGVVPACLRGHYFSAVIEERRRGEPRTATRNLTHTRFWPKSNLLVVDKKAATDLIQTKCAVHKPLLA